MLTDLHNTPHPRKRKKDQKGTPDFSEIKWKNACGNYRRNSGFKSHLFPRMFPETAFLRNTCHPSLCGACLSRLRRYFPEEAIGVRGYLYVSGLQCVHSALNMGLTRRSSCPPSDCKALNSYWHCPTTPSVTLVTQAIITL